MDNVIRQPAPKEEVLYDRVSIEPRKQATFNQEVREAMNGRYAKTWWTTTTSATPTLIWSMQMPTNSVWLVDMRVLGYCTVDGSAATYERSVRVTSFAGSPTVVRTTTPVADDEDVGAWDVTITAGADGILSLAVTGDGLRTIDWVAWVAVQEAPRRSA